MARWDDPSYFGQELASACRGTTRYVVLVSGMLLHCCWLARVLARVLVRFPWLLGFEEVAGCDTAAAAAAVVRVVVWLSRLVGLLPSRHSKSWLGTTCFRFPWLVVVVVAAVVVAAAAADFVYCGGIFPVPVAACVLIVLHALLLSLLLPLAFGLPFLLDFRRTILDLLPFVRHFEEVGA